MSQTDVTQQTHFQRIPAVNTLGQPRLTVFPELCGLALQLLPPEFNITGVASIMAHSILIKIENR